MKIGHPKNFFGGLLFILIGGMFAIVAKGLTIGESVLIPGYAMGTPARMGPGFFPFYLGLILVGLGIIILIEGLRHHPRDPGKVDKFHWKPILLILFSVVMFGVLLRPIGMLLAGFLLVIVASLGSHDFRVKRTIFLGLGLVTFSALVFVGGLKLPIPLCPDVEAIQSTIGFCRG